MRKKKVYEDSNFWIGFGTYWLLHMAIAFYPAVVFAAWIVEWTRPGKGEEETILYLLTGPLFFIVFAFCIGRMVSVLRDSWPALLGLYAITLYPFIKWLSWMSGPSDVLWPGVDWFPW